MFPRRWIEKYNGYKNIDYNYGNNAGQEKTRDATMENISLEKRKPITIRRFSTIRKYFLCVP